MTSASSNILFHSEKKCRELLMHRKQEGKGGREGQICHLIIFRLEEEGYKTIVLLFTTLTGRGQAKQVRSATPA